MRPELTKDISLACFQNYYWLKAELQLFCRENSIPAVGSKGDVTHRIATFLQTGEILKPTPKRKANTKRTQSPPLSLDTVITENHRCSQDVRAFFKSIVPTFHFSTYIQRYFKDHVGKTYRDALSAWEAEEKRKKDPSYTKPIGVQFEYNQFIRDYFSDQKNKGKSQKDAIEAWNKIKNQPGSNRYPR